MKVCSNCKQEKDSSEFYKKGKYSDDLGSRCKPCCINATNKCRIANPEQRKVHDKKYRIKNCKKLKIYNKKWYEANKEKVRVTSKKWRIANREKERARVKEWREKNHEKSLATDKKYRTENYEKMKAATKKWQAANRDKVRETWQRRRARKLNAYVAPVDRQEIFKRDGGRCHICKNKVNPKKWHLDHIMSLSKGGTHEPKNVAVSHPKCNMQKHASGTAQLRLIN